jgi:N-acetylmuramic acid 6-phosphate etherase
MVTTRAYTGAPQLDLLPVEDVVSLLLDAERRVVPAVRAAQATIAAGARLLGAHLAAGKRVVFCGAGTSGRLAVAEAAELPGTFGLPREQVVAMLAGGGLHSLAGTDFDEDDADAAARDMAAIRLSPDDLLVAVAASGRTPYTLAALRAAVAERAAVIAVVNVAGSPLADLADVAIEVPVGDEVLRGSTRLTAGTAQKVALNALTTAAMTRAGRVHGDLMVDVVAANEKLQRRSAGIVAEIADVPEERAWTALEACGWQARAAVLHLVLDLAPDAAIARAAAYPSLRAALTAGSA